MRKKVLKWLRHADFEVGPGNRLHWLLTEVWNLRTECAQRFFSAASSGRSLAFGRSSWPREAHMWRRAWTPGLITAIIRGCCSPWAKQGFELMNPALAWGERVNFGFIIFSSAAAPSIWNQIDTANDWNLFRKQLLVPAKTATFLSFIYLLRQCAVLFIYLFFWWSVYLILS